MIQRSLYKIGRTYPFFSLNTNKQYFQNDSPVQRVRNFDNQNRKVFKKQQFTKKTKPQQQKNRAANYTQTNVSEEVSKINQINKYFLGISQNTDYFKVYIQKKFEDCLKSSLTKYQISQLPFKITKQKLEYNANSLTLKNNRACKLVLGWISQQKLTKQIKNLICSYFYDLVNKQRKCRIQPNFEWESHKIIQTLKSNGVSFSIKSQREPNVFIENISILKGVKVNRNDNYTVDSYQVNFQNQNEGITAYKLWKKQKQQYPEAQWFAARASVARIEVSVTNVPIIQVKQAATVVGTTENSIHKFTFEVDLIVPPMLAQLSLSPEQYQKSYRLSASQIKITNVDSKNSYFQIAFNQMQKKQKLINKLV